MKGVCMRYVGIVGNNATTSTNRTLLHYIAKRYSDQAEFDVQEIRPLPAFKASDDEATPAEVQVLVDAIAGCDGVIIATPEYNHTIPAPLKSALEWLSWSGSVMRGMPVMIVGASYGRLGTSRAQQHLRDILTSPWLRARALASEYLLDGSLTAFDDNGDLVDPADVEALDSHFAEFQAFTQIIKDVNAKERAL